MLRKEHILGAWKLVSHEKQLEDGSFVPTSSGAHGRILYTPEGFMSASINWDDRFLFYSGRFDFRERDQTVVHHVENATEDWRMGKSLERRASLEGDSLALEGKVTNGYGRILWQREKSEA